MNEQEYEQLVEASWRRALTPEEEAALQLHLAANPAQQLQWDDEAALSTALRHLPDAPLASNFTAQVLQAIDREEMAAQRSADPATPLGWWRRWYPRLVSAAAILVLAMTCLNLYQVHHRKNATEMVVAVSDVVGSALPSPEVLEDFETIQHLQTAPQFTDDELVAALLKE